MQKADAIYFDESQLSKDQTMETLENGDVLVTATVPFTSQLVWWLRSFGKKLIQIEPVDVANVVHQTQE